jgi:hypothetical protein
MDNLWNTYNDSTPPTNLPSQTNSYQSLLQQAQQFSQMSIQHIHSTRQQINHTSNSEMQSLHELVLAYDKLSSIKWGKARQAYETHANNAILEKDDVQKKLEEDQDVDNMLRDTLKQSLNTKTPGKKKDNTVNAANHMNNEGLNPHDWITNAFQNHPGTPTTALQVMGLPPGFGDEEANEASEQQSCNESVCSSSSEAITTKCTSTPSEISSLGTQEYGEEIDDEYSLEELMESYESPSLSNDDFDYIYRGGFAIKANNGQEIKGVVPKNAKRVLIDSSVRAIEECAFQGCNELEYVTIPPGVEEICDNAFRKCSKLSTVKFLRRRGRFATSKELPGFSDEKKTEDSDGRVVATSAPRSLGGTTSQLRTIGEWAFFNCSSLESINLPYGLETIGTRAFQRCSVLNLEELPSSLVSVGDNAFSGCSRETRAVLEQWGQNRV